MNILITGGMGNLGSRLLVQLVKRGEKVILFDLRKEPLIPSPEFAKTILWEGDVRDGENLLEAVRTYKVDAIFHLASLLSAKAEEAMDAAWQINLNGTRNVFEAARRGAVRKVVYSSSLAVYGPGLPEPLPIDAPLWPASLYGVTKVAGDCLGNYYHKRFGIDFRSIRFPTLVSHKGAIGAASSFCSAIFKEAVEKGMFEFKIKPSSTFPIVYIEDAMKAFLLLFYAPAKNLKRRVYNLHGLGLSAEELAGSVLKRLPEVKITYRPDALLTAIVDSWPRLIDDREAREDWGWNPAYDLDRMAEEIINTLKRGWKDE